MSAQPAVTEQLTTRIYRDMLYKTMRGEKFPVYAGKAYGTWINKSADLRQTGNTIEAFNGYTWQPISILTLRVWLRRARQQRTGRNVRPTTPVVIGARIVAIDPDTGKLRSGTVKEFHAGTGAVRVEFDLKWTHDWLSAEKVEVL